MMCRVCRQSDDHRPDCPLTGGSLADGYIEVEIEVDVDTQDPEGWWIIGGTEILAALRKVAEEGTDPDVVYAELYANANIHRGPA